MRRREACLRERGVRGAMSLAADQRTRSCATELVCHDCGLRLPLLDTTFKCLGCGQGLDVDYDYELATARSAEQPDRGARAEHLALRGAAADRRRQGAGAGRPLQRPHAADPRRSARRRAGPAQALSQGRQHAAPQPLLQGPRRLDGGRAPAGAGQGGDRLRLDRQRRHRRRLAGRQGRGRRLRLLPEQPGAGQGARLPGARRHGDPARRQLRRGEPRLPRAGPGERHPVRQHHPAPVLRGGGEDDGLRGGRAARLGCSPDHFVIPAAGGTLSSRVHKGLGEMETVGMAETAATKIHVAQAAGLRPDRHRDPRRQRQDRGAAARRRPPTRWRSAPPATGRWSSRR